jgi:DNA-binding MarR family transcriptional regulator
MTQDLSRCLHVLTIRADRAADRILHGEHGISYSRFLALYAVSEAGASSQRAVAERLGVSEPSVSRMVQVLAGEGWLMLEEPPAGGNRRSLRLTEAGVRIVAEYGQLLEQRFADLVEKAGVSYPEYRDDTLRLLAALGAEEQGRATAPTDTAAHAHGAHS